MQAFMRFSPLQEIMRVPGEKQQRILALVDELKALTAYAEEEAHIRIRGCPLSTSYLPINLVFQ